MKRIVYETKNQMYRIVEHVESDYDLENLKGDLYNPKHMLEMCGPEMTVEKLRAEELEFEELVAREGVYGYVLERWNPKPGCGYEHVDSCWGFVGRFSETEEQFNHYIVHELKMLIPARGSTQGELDECDHNECDSTCTKGA